ncbi:ABC transporter ATP-binding protein [Peptoniphilus indolicus]|uniref:ABC superfamily ATP binding cassette transporter ABC protein n=2 Tax=Peptoniphilus indolicus TaxID=33030 RepID=G4D6I7_9FIRM|nr:ABC transporter ATP-binding protein [Peptoniphilus indolicus]EGY76560.1 ABC superfamily ATP binding cassette transporter ABC protein [Peptoniphilus indolicus ATCC 29427]SUB74447.1 Putative HMP/thiamine import ATP-binding protein YkoD [Peptoniphilus indolicus]
MLSVKNLKFSYKGNNVLEDINFDVYEGQVLCLTGASGSGKSTLIKIINEVIPEIYDGEIDGKIVLDKQLINDKNIADRSAYISTVFQNPKTQFFCVESTDELAFPLENRNVEKEDIEKSIEKYTNLLNTEKLLNRNIFSLSGGEKQLMAVTSVMTMDNKVYLFDEPSSSLDHKAIELLKNAIIQLKKMGKIVIIAEHRLYYLMGIIDSLAILKDGKVKIFPKEVLSDIKLKELQGKYFLRSFNEISKSSFEEKSYKKIHLLDKGKIETEDACLECKNFMQDFKKTKIMDLEQISFSQGIIFLIGDNGVGKSTFINKLSKLIKGRGKSFYKGKEIKESYNHISMVMQDVNYQIFTESVWNEISIVSDDDIKKERILREFCLYNKKDSHPQALSGGEKQRLMIALAIVSEKPIIILDEPTSGLCKKQMLSVIKYLKRLKNEGKTIIVITHDYEFIYECGGTVYEFVKQ